MTSVVKGASIRARPAAETLGERAERLRFLGLAQGVVTGRQAVDRLVKRTVRKPLAGESAGEAGRDRPLGQLEGVAEMAAGQARVVEVLASAIRPNATWTQMLSPQPWRA